MKNNALTLFAIAPLALLAACGEEPAPAPVETPVVAEPEAPEIPPPDATFFTQKFAEICPNAEPVNTAACRRRGMGSPEVLCEFGLGDDEYLRHESILVQGETEWEIADPETTCAAGA
ncbi:hypothetical protein [uncultured Erythrobacter sp.]|uniref:hypothetical protein n=1 Tax=uncultured Erythrobacter sp. TaxID=263913 RepID=UPI0026093868|nr:hypothetical protein [uncultured Erythrobacter sp.]